MLDRWGWGPIHSELGVRGRIGVLSMAGLPQPQQNITYLGAHRLETRQGADCHTLVIHAATLGAGQHVYETVHLRRGATLCREHKQVKVDTYTDAREHGQRDPQPTLPPTPVLQEARWAPLPSLAPRPAVGKLWPV